MSLQNDDRVHPREQLLITWMHAMAESIRAINAERLLDHVLALVARQACELLGLQKCAIYVLDSRAGTFRLEGSYGLTDRYVHWANSEPMRIDEGRPDAGPPTARAALMGVPIVVQDGWAEPGLDRWREHMTAEGLRGVLAAPLQTADGQSIGTITGYTTGLRDFDETDTRLLALLSEHAAAAIIAARRRDREREVIALLTQANERLIEEQRTVIRLRSLQHDLTRLLLQDVGMHGIAEFLAERLRATIAISTVANAELATAPEGSPLAAEIDAAMTDPALAWQIAKVIESGRAGDLVRENGVVVCLVPVSTDDAASIRLWVTRADEKHFDDDERSAMEGCALLVALEQSRVERRADAEARLTKDLLADLLSPSAALHPAPVMARAGILGHAPYEPHVPLVFLTPTPGGETAGEFEHSGARRSRGTDGIVRSLLSATRDLRPRPVIGSVGEFTVMLLPVTADEARFDRQVDSALQAVRGETNGHARCVMGEAVDALSDLERGLAGVLRAASLVTPHSREVTRMTDFGIRGLLLEAGSGQALRELSAVTLEPIKSLDEKSSGDYLTTVKAWFAANMSNRAAGSALFVHPNTVGYRLRRVSDATGLNLADPADLLTLQLALIVDDVTGSAPTGSPRMRRSGTEVRPRSGRGPAAQ